MHRRKEIALQVGCIVVYQFTWVVGYELLGLESLQNYSIIAIIVFTTSVLPNKHLYNWL